MRILSPKSFLIGTLIVLIAAATLFFISWNQFLTTPLTQKPIIFLVGSGSSIKTVSKKLEHLGVIKHPNYFMLLAFKNGVTKHIKAGEYQIDAGSTPEQFLIKLAKGRVVLHRFTIVEGWTLQQVLASSSRNSFLRHTLNPLTITQFSAKLGCPNNNLEGYLYPDTYLFARGVKDTVILKQAYSLMQRKLQQAWQQRAQNLPYKTPYEALIVASLIERETARLDERPKISGVILRRIENNMPLQIDAAIIYGLGSNYQGKIKGSDLRVDTPFNNYLHRGLPPSPIGMPSYSSIVAAVHPQPGTELYYVARGDGSHEFTNSLEEHRKAIQKFRVNYLENWDEVQPKPSNQNQLPISLHQDVFRSWAQNISWFDNTDESLPKEQPTATHRPVNTSNKSKATKLTNVKTKKVKRKNAQKGHHHARKK